MKGVKGFQPGHKPSQVTRDRISAALSRQVAFFCDYCYEQSSDKPSHYARKKRHFCSNNCYSLFRKERMPFEEQNSYKGVRIPGSSKQVYYQRYAKNNPERISHLKARRYAREKGADGTHSLEEWEEVKALFNQSCGICYMGKPLTKDHVVPLSKGGNDYIDNIQPLCRNCNSQKWTHIHQNPELLETGE